MSLSETIKSKFPNLVIESASIPAASAKGDATLIIKKEGIKDLMSFLKNDSQYQFNVLMDLFCVDYLHWEEKAARFEVVYNLFSTAKTQRLFVKVQLPEAEPSVDSISGIWPAANWYEREVWDMFGIRFNGHPDLKRILMYEEFTGHALRKDYPYNSRQPLVGPHN